MLQQFLRMLLVLMLVSSAPRKKVPVIHLTEASSQRWAGGISGRSGCNYTLIFTTQKGKGEATPDSIRIRNEGVFAIAPRSSTDKADLFCESFLVGQLVKYTLRIEARHTTGTGKTVVPIPPADTSLNAAALLYYHTAKRNGVLRIAHFSEKTALQFP